MGKFLAGIFRDLLFLEFVLLLVDFFTRLPDQPACVFDGFACVRLGVFDFLTDKRFRSCVHANRDPFTGAHAGATEFCGQRILHPHAKFEIAFFGPFANEIAYGLLDAPLPGGCLRRFDFIRCIDWQAGRVAVFRLDFQFGRAEPDIICDFETDGEDLVRPDAGFLFHAGDPANRRWSVWLGLDVETCAIKFSFEPVVERNAACAQAGGIEFPAADQAASIRCGLKNGLADGFAVDFHPHAFDRGVELGFQLNFGSNDALDAFAERLLACRPFSVGRIF